MRTPPPLRPAPRASGAGWVLCSYLSFAALFHFVWEIAHVRLYTIWWTAPFSESVYAIIHCTVGDVLIAATSMGLACLVVRAERSGPRPFGKLVTAATIIGVTYTMFSEWLNVDIRQTWSYTEAMPRVPLLGIGLTPVLQWLVVTPVAAFAARNNR